MASGASKELSGVMADTIVAHVPGAQRGEGARVELGVGGLSVECVVWPKGLNVVQLDAWWSGGIFGSATFAQSWAGAAADRRVAVVEAVHLWVEQPLRAVLSAARGEAPDMAVSVHGVPFGLFADGIVVRGAAGEAFREAAKVRAPIHALVASGALPAFHPRRAHHVEVYGAAGKRPILEVKVDGRLWPLANGVPAAFLPEVPEHEFFSFRQTAVLLPPPNGQGYVPSLASIGTTVHGLALSDAERAVFGARTHDHVLHAPYDEATVAGLEQAHGVRLPPDYRAFITQVAASGAGPGYGLMPLHTEEQRRGLRGPFAPTAATTIPEGPEKESDAYVAGTITLAHLGCGYFALLVVDGPAYGQVWLDLRCIEPGQLVPAAPSFAAFYLDWLDGALVREIPALPIGAEQCAMPHAMSSFFEAWEKRHDRPVDVPRAVQDIGLGALRVSSSSTNRYWDRQDSIDICPGCERLRENLGMEPNRIGWGDPPKPARGGTRARTATGGAA